MKKKNVSRLIALALASALCFGACGQQGKEQETSKESEQSASESKVQESSSEVAELEDVPYWELLDQVSDTSELPDWEGEILEINIWNAGGTAAKLGEIPDTNVTYKELERVTGVRINAEESFDNGGVSVDAKLPMVIASGELPTVIIGYSMDAAMKELYENGYLADLTKYYEDGTLDQVDNALPFDKAQSVVYKNYQAEDGAYYLLPVRVGNANTLASIYDMIEYYPEEFDREFHLTYGSAPAATGNKTVNDTILVRDDILKAVRPDALSRNEIEEVYLENGTFTEEQIYGVNINSLDEFVEFLHDVQEELDTGKYTDLNGNAMEVTYGPHTEVDNWPWMYTLFGLTNGMAYASNYFATMDYTATDPSKFLIKSYLHEDTVYYMKALNGLVRENIIAQDSMLDNKANFIEKCNNGHYAVGYQNVDLLNLPENDEWRYSPVWLNIPANEKFGGMTAMSYNNYFGVFKDALTEEELDQLMHAVNYLNSEVGVLNFFWGPESAGLFDVDADGNRYWTDADVKACMDDKVDNGANVKYGLHGASVAQQPYYDIMHGILGDVLKPSYKNSGKGELKVEDATKYFNPGILPGDAYADSAMYFTINANVYNGVGQSVEGLKQFWTAREGFENQFKKVIVAESDAEFDKQLKALDDYAIENGFDDKALSEFNNKFVEANEDALRLYGFIE